MTTKLISKLQGILLYLRFKLFPKTIYKTTKGRCLEQYCLNILNETDDTSDYIQAYEDMLKDIQHTLNTSRTMAAIYVVSVLGDVNENK